MFNIKEINQQPNTLTLAEYNFSLIEQRIMYLIINQIEKGIDMSEDLFRNKTFTIPIKHLGETNFKRVKEAAKNLMNKKIVPADDNQRYEAVVPFPKISVENGGQIEITMFAEVLPLFAELKNGYTQYRLNAALSLRSTYSQRLYEMLCRFKDTGMWKKVKIESLRKKIGLTEDQYTQFGMFRKRVLDRAMKEINEKTDISFTYELHKSHNKYTYVTFYIDYGKVAKQIPKELDKLTELVSKDERSKRALDYLVEYKIIDPKIQYLILTDYQAEFWKWNFEWKNLPQYQKTKVMNPAGKLLKDLGIIVSKAS